MFAIPFPIPFGWFQVAWPHEVAQGEVKPLFYFDRHLAIWRDELGELHLMDAFCPHLGAHLAHGGYVEGTEVVCPFHGWKYDAEGRNCDIPYSERVNRSAKIRTYPVVERNGLVMAWYHPHDEAPMWEIPVLPEFNDDPDYTPMTTKDYVIKSSWQEMAENSVDSAHFRFVHGTDIVPEIEEYEHDGPFARMRSAQKFPTPRGVVDGRIDVDQFGPGFGVTRFSGIVDTSLMGCNTPIDANTCHLRFDFTAKKVGDENTTSTVGEAFVNEVHQQVLEDKPIWENKAHLVRPALADTDGPYMKFRKWASQFYAEPVDAEQAAYPPDPPEPGETIIVIEMGRTASKRLAKQQA